MEQTKQSQMNEYTHNIVRFFYKLQNFLKGVSIVKNIKKSLVAYMFSNCRSIEIVIVNDVRETIFPKL